MRTQQYLVITSELLEAAQGAATESLLGWGCK